MPPAVRAWAPNRIGFATAVYTNGLLIGEILPVALMLPLVLPLVGSWQWGFVFWSAAGRRHRARGAGAGAAAGRRRKPRPRAAAGGRIGASSLIWRLGIMLGTVNAMYFATNAFLPDYLSSHGQGEWISAALTGLNIGQLPASILLLIFASRLELRAWPYVVCGLHVALSTAGVVFGSGIWVVVATVAARLFRRRHSGAGAGACRRCWRRPTTCIASLPPCSPSAIVAR